MAEGTRQNQQPTLFYYLCWYRFRFSDYQNTDHNTEVFFHGHGHHNRGYIIIMIILSHMFLFLLLSICTVKNTTTFLCSHLSNNSNFQKPVVKIWWFLVDSVEGEWQSCFLSFWEWNIFSVTDWQHDFLITFYFDGRHILVSYLIRRMVCDM